MKKLTAAVLTFLVLGAFGSEAYSAPKGSQTAGVQLSYVSPLEGLSDEADSGVSLGLSLTHQWRQRVALVAEAELSRYIREPGGGPGTTDSQLNAVSVSLLGRFELAPDSRLKPYLLLGPGITEGELRFSGTPPSTPFETTERFTSLGYVAGLGIVRELGKSWKLGLETRYKAFSFFGGGEGKFANFGVGLNLSYLLPESE